MSTGSKPSTTSTDVVIVDPLTRWEGDADLHSRVVLLKQLSGLEAGRIRILETGTRLAIGRTTTEGLRVADDSCSRNHVEISCHGFQDGRPDVRVVDQASSNGSFIGGQKLKPRIESSWSPGEVLQLGANSRFVYLMVSRDDAEAMIWAAENSHRDPLTQHLNQQGFLEALTRELQFLKREPALQIAVVLMRVRDYSDSIPETKHMKIIRDWLQELSKVIRAGTILGRINDTDFMLLLRKCDVPGAKAALERFSETLAKSKDVEQSLAKPVLGCLIVSGKYACEAPDLLEYAQREIFRGGMDPTSHPVIEYLPPTKLARK